MNRKFYTCISTAIEEADFEAAERGRQMYVMQLDGARMVVSQRCKSYGGRVMYRTGIRR